MTELLSDQEQIEMIKNGGAIMVALLLLLSLLVY